MITGPVTLAELRFHLEQAQEIAASLGLRDLAPVIGLILDDLNGNQKKARLELEALMKAVNA